MIDLKKSNNTNSTIITTIATNNENNNYCLNDSLNNSKNSSNSLQLLDSTELRTSPLYETSLIYCDLCDYSCDLSNKLIFINHFIDKHFQQLNNITYNYLLSQLNDDTLKKKYYLIKAQLKLKYKETSSCESYEQQLFNDDFNEDEEEEEENEIKSILFKICNKVILENIIEDIDEEQQLFEFNSDDIINDLECCSFKDNNDLLIQHLLQNNKLKQFNNSKQDNNDQKLIQQNQNSQQNEQQTMLLNTSQNNHVEESGENLFIFKVNFNSQYRF